MTAADSEVMRRARAVRAVVFDVDGVLTDGRVLYGDDGRELVGFHVRDGFGLKRLLANGLEVAVVTGRSSAAVAQRMAALGIRHVYRGYDDKLAALEELQGRLHVPPESLAGVGDDVLDLPILSRVGFAVAVADAHPEVRARAHWQTPSPGGHGAAREVCDLILAAQGRGEGELTALLGDGPAARRA